MIKLVVAIVLLAGAGVVVYLNFKPTSPDELANNEFKKPSDIHPASGSDAVAAPQPAAPASPGASTPAYTGGGRRQNPATPPQ